MRFTNRPVRCTVFYSLSALSMLGLTSGAGAQPCTAQSALAKGSTWTYGYETAYNTWLCPESSRQLSLAGETGNGAYVHVNSVHSLLSEVGDMNIDGERSMVWMLARRVGDLRGETLYEAWHGSNDGVRALLFTRPGASLWKPVSQKQYLDALATYGKDSGGDTTDAMDEVERGMIEQIAEIKRELTGDIRDQVVAEMERGLAQMRARRPASNSRLSGAVAEALEYITDYLAAHSEQEMQQPAFLPEGLKLGFRGEFRDESQDGHMLVRVDPDYFRRDLSPEVAQLVMLLWTWENESEASDRWRLSLERNFPLDRLRSMIDRRGDSRDA